MTVRADKVRIVGGDTPEIGDEVLARYERRAERELHPWTARVGVAAGHVAGAVVAALLYGLVVLAIAGGVLGVLQAGQAVWRIVS